MPHPRRLLVIHNPAAGRRRKAFAAAVVAALRADGAEVVVQETGAAGDAERFARTAGPSTDVVVAAGGDGTVNEVINGLAARPQDALSPALGVIPLGTTNVLARELALPEDAGALAGLLAHGRTLPLHTGIANGRRFALMVGVGFDARVVRRIDPRLKRWMGRGAYGLAILRELIAYAPIRYRVSVDEREPIDAAAVIVAKGRLYGGPFELAADASVHRPTLHVCLFLNAGRLSAMRYLAAVGLGRIAQADGFRIVSASRVAIAGPAGEPVQGDGDNLTTLPLEIALASEAFAVIALPS